MGHLLRLVIDGEGQPTGDGVAPGQVIPGCLKGPAELALGTSQTAALLHGLCLQGLSLILP